MNVKNQNLALFGGPKTIERKFDKVDLDSNELNNIKILSNSKNNKVKSKDIKGSIIITNYEK